MMLAKAAFDNAGETAEELSFRRGDVLNVLQIDPNGLEGWWLCSLKGVIGIAPGNRLKQITGQQDSGTGELEHIENIRRNKELNSVNRKSYVQDSDKVVTPQRIGSVFLYDSPQGSAMPISAQDPLPMEDYDIPRHSTQPVSKQQHNITSHYPLPGYDVYDSPKPSSTTVKANVKAIEDIYDTPSNRNRLMGAFEHLSLQDSGSNRSSGISVLSGISGMNASNASLHSGGSASTRSSVDVSSHDIYDIPPAPRIMDKKSSSLGDTKILSDLNSQEMYDTPQKKSVNNVCVNNNNKFNVKGSNNKKVGNKNIPIAIETWGGDYCEIKEDNINIRTSPDSGVGGVFGKHQHEHVYEEPGAIKEHIIDDLPMYDCPKNSNASYRINEDSVNKCGRVQGYQSSSRVEGGGVYDVPPQVTKDSMDVLLPGEKQQQPLRHPRSSGTTSVLPSEDILNVPYDELALEMNAAIELLVTLQQDLHKASSRLLSYVTSTWRKRENLEPKLFDVKISCLAVRTALQEFVEFGQGALANSARLGDNTLFTNLKGFVDPLQKAAEVVNKCKKSLDATKWDINKIATDLVDSNIIDDDLNQIVEQCKNCGVTSKQLGSFIQTNAVSLFQRNEFGQIQDPILVAASIIRHKPPPVKPKPKLGNRVSVEEVDDRSHRFSERPLPTPPLRRKEVQVTPLPPSRAAAPNPPIHSTPERDISGTVPQQSMIQGNDSSSVSQSQGLTSPIAMYGATEDYDIPKTQQEREELFLLKTKLFNRQVDDANSNDNINKRSVTSTAPGNLSINTSNRSDDYDNAKTNMSYQDYENDDVAEQEYDYVALTPDQAKKSLAFRYFEEGTVKRAITRQSEMYDEPTKVSSSSGNTEIIVDESVTDGNTLTQPRRHLVQQQAVHTMYDSPVGSRSLDLGNNKSMVDLYDSPGGGNKSVDMYDSPQNSSAISQREHHNNTSFSGSSFDLDMSGQSEGLQLPNIRTSGLSSKFKEKIQQLQHEAEATNITHHQDAGLVSDVNLTRQRNSQQVSQIDKQILSFYFNQVESQETVLVHAMEAMFQAVDYNQPPKVFIAHSKFVILSAHKLVYIADTISRNLTSEQIRNGIMLCANTLCDCLKATVTATKKAALQYPSIPAVQEMVDRVVDISHAADRFKFVVARTANT